MSCEKHYSCPKCKEPLELVIIVPEGKQPEDVYFGADTVFMCSGQEKHEYSVIQRGYFQEPGKQINQETKWKR